MNKNKKALGIMLGTLVFLLVLAVVLLSVIIVSLAKDDAPEITTIPKISQTNPPVQTTGKQTTFVWNTNPRPPITEDPEVTTGPVGNTNTGTSGTTDDLPHTTTPNVTPNPPVGPNTPVGEIVTVENPDGSIVRSGSFRDNGSTSLHLLIEWEARYASKDATSAALTVRVYLQSYSIGVSGRDGNTLSIGGDTTTFQTSSIFYSTNDVHNTLLTSRTVTVGKSSSTAMTEVDLSAAWNFKATYSGTYIDWLTVAGTIEV